MPRLRAVSCSQDSTCRTTTGTTGMRTVGFGLPSSRLQGFGRWRSGCVVSCFAVPVWHEARQPGFHHTDIASGNRCHCKHHQLHVYHSIIFIGLGHSVSCHGMSCQIMPCPNQSFHVLSYHILPCHILYIILIISSHHHHHHLLYSSTPAAVCPNLQELDVEVIGLDLNKSHGQFVCLIDSIISWSLY